MSVISLDNKVLWMRVLRETYAEGGQDNLVTSLTSSTTLFQKNYPDEGLCTEALFIKSSMIANEESSVRCPPTLVQKFLLDSSSSQR